MSVEVAYLRCQEMTPEGAAGLSPEDISSIGPSLYWVGPWSCQLEHVGSFAGPLELWRVYGPGAISHAAATGHTWNAAGALPAPLVSEMRSAGHIAVRRKSTQAIEGIALRVVFSGETRLGASANALGLADAIDDLEEA